MHYLSKEVLLNLEFPSINSRDVIVTIYAHQANPELIRKQILFNGIAQKMMETGVFKNKANCKPIESTIYAHANDSPGLAEIGYIEGTEEYCAAQQQFDWDRSEGRSTWPEDCFYHPLRGFYLAHDETDLTFEKEVERTLHYMRDHIVSHTPDYLRTQTFPKVHASHDARNISYEPSKDEVTIDSLLQELLQKKYTPDTIIECALNVARFNSLIESITQMTGNCDHDSLRASKFLGEKIHQLYCLFPQADIAQDNALRTILERKLLYLLEDKIVKGHQAYTLSLSA